MQEALPATQTKFICGPGEGQEDVIACVQFHAGGLARGDARLRQGAMPHITPELFDRLRQSYEQPSEWTGAQLQVSAGSTAIVTALTQLGVAVS